MASFHVGVLPRTTGALPDDLTRKFRLILLLSMINMLMVSLCLSFEGLTESKIRSYIASDAVAAPIRALIYSAKGQEFQNRSETARKLRQSTTDKRKFQYDSYDYHCTIVRSHVSVAFCVVAHLRIFNCRRLRKPFPASIRSMLCMRPSASGWKDRRSSQRSCGLDFSQKQPSKVPMHW